MSIQLKAGQMEKIAESRFLGRLREILLEGLVDRRATFDELASPAGTAMLRMQVANANRYGLTSELDVARYVITAWLLGVDFDTRFPAMAEVLASEQLTPSQKAEALERLATTLLQTLNGEVAP